MNRTTIGVLVIMVLGLLMVGIWALLAPSIEKEKEKKQAEEAQRSRIEASDATASHTIRLAGDGYIGYWFASQSPEMKKLSLRKGIRVDFTDDGGAYAERLRKFAAGEYEVISLPVAEYLVHGRDQKYPGVIVAAIAESRDADGIVAFEDKVPTGKVNDLNRAGLKGAYIPGSPNSFLLDLAISGFDLSNLAGSTDWRVEVKDPKETLQKLRQQQVDFGVLWEPELSQALREIPNLKLVFGSGSFRGYIIDVFVFRSEYLAKNEAQVKGFLDAYFQALRIYSGNKPKLMEELTRSTGLKPEVAELMLQKVEWFDLYENASVHFGIPTSPGGDANDGVVNCILACMDVLNRTSQKGSPLNVDPYLISNSKIVKDLLSSTPMSVGNGGGKKVDFEALNDAQWAKLKEIGVLRVEPVKFETGESQLTADGVEQVEKIYTMLEQNFPECRIAVRGHTSPGADESESVALSLARAAMVVQRLKALGIDPDRLRAEGFGSSRPPEPQPGESRNSRKFLFRMQRVEIVLLQGNNL